MDAWRQGRRKSGKATCSLESGGREEVTLRIFHVERGGCAHADTPRCGGVLVDCGLSTATGFRPSTWLRSTSRAKHLRGLVLSTLNTAYVADLQLVVAALEQARICVGPHVFQRAVELLPNQELCTIDRFEQAIGPLELRLFCNNDSNVGDPRDLSVVTLVRTPSLGIVLGSELQRSGWRTLLGQEDFREALRTVDIFVASDNGRRSGFCAEIFEICEPRLIVLQGSRSIADAADVYADHAAGLEFADGALRSILSTASHGTITITDPAEGSPTCAAELLRRRG